MKKYIGLALWLLAFAIPFRYAILETDDLLGPDGSVNNVKGLFSFLALVALLFVGYVLIDSASPKPGSSDQHGH
jgi:hypothetical protein